jgi:hypothetical protein
LAAASPLSAIDGHLGKREKGANIQTLAHPGDMRMQQLARKQHGILMNRRQIWQAHISVCRLAWVFLLMFCV